MSGNDKEPMPENPLEDTFSEQEKERWEDEIGRWKFWSRREDEDPHQHRERVRLVARQAQLVEEILNEEWGEWYRELEARRALTARGSSLGGPFEATPTPTPITPAAGEAGPSSIASTPSLGIDQPVVARRLELEDVDEEEDPSEEEEPMEEEEEPMVDEALPESSEEIVMWEEEAPTPEIIVLSDDSDEEDPEVQAAIAAEWDEFLAPLPQLPVEDEVGVVDQAAAEFDWEAFIPPLPDFPFWGDFEAQMGGEPVVEAVFEPEIPIEAHPEEAVMMVESGDDTGDEDSSEEDDDDSSGDSDFDPEQYQEDRDRIDGVIP